MSSAVTAAEFQALVVDAVPLTRMIEPEDERLDAGYVRLRAPFRPDCLRPGGTVSGPVLTAPPDSAMSARVMSLLGRADLAVTTHSHTALLCQPAHSLDALPGGTGCCRTP